MSDIKPLVVVFDDKFNGMYSGGKWTAWNKCYVPSKIFGDAKECAEFFANPRLIFGRGETPQEAIDDLKHMRYYGSHMVRERIKEVNESTEDEKDNKMEPTSVWKIENIDDIWITQEGDEMSLQLKNRDDITKIILTGDAIKNHNEQFVTVLKVDMEENEKLKEEISRCNKVNKDLGSHAIELEKKMHGIRKNSTFGFGPAPKNPSTRSDILDQAKKCVCGQREQDYGTPESNFRLIADLWNGYLGGRTDNPVISVTPVDVSMMMALMKIARIRNGGGSGDSFVDLAGYAACGGEIWHGQKVKDQN